MPPNHHQARTRVTHIVFVHVTISIVATTRAAAAVAGAAASSPHSAASSTQVRGRIQVAADADQDAVHAAAMQEENVQRHVGDAEPRKVIFVPGRLLNIVPG